MPAYVTLPGTSTNNFSTPDRNLLPADDAHFHQSIGNWSAGAGASTLAQDTGGTPTPQVGEGTAKATTDGTGAVIATLTTPSLSAAEHTVSIDIYTDTADREAFVTLDGTDGTVTALAAGEWTRISATKTVTAGTKSVTVTYRQTNDSDPAAAEEVWLDAACLSADTDTTFLESFRVVGDLEIETKLAADNWTAGTFRQILDTLTTNGGYQLTLYSNDTLAIDFRTSAGLVQEATSAMSVTNGTTTVFKISVDVSAGSIVYYQDGVQFDTDTFTANPIDPRTETMVIGSSGTGTNPWDGTIHYVIVRDGIGGPVVARFDADDWVGV